MDGNGLENDLRLLYLDLLALSTTALPSIDRLVLELEASIEQFRALLDKKPKNNESRQKVLSGEIEIDDARFSLNSEFRQHALEVADALDVDEIHATRFLLDAQSDSSKLDRSPVMTAIIRFHERRAFLLECLRVILSESFEVEREGTQAIMQETVGQILQIHNGPLRNGSLFTRKCLDAMVDIEKWLVLLGDQIQKASIVGQAQESDIMEIIEFQRQSLLKQHESLGTILHFLFKGSYASSEDLRKLLEKLRKMDKFDLPLVHYIPAVISSFAQYGSPDGQGQYQEARSLHQAITDSKEPYSWALPKLHAAAIVFWLAEYAGWYFDNGPASSPQGTDPTKEAANLSKMFLTALDDGAFEFILEICAGMDVEERDNPARNELVGLLLKDGTSLTAEPDDVSPHFRDSLITCVELFTESLIANMPDTIRMLKSEEDLRRLDQITALREGLTSNLHRGLVEARMHLESLLLIIAFAFERRPDAAQEFWTDPDGNLHGFLLWSSKRQTVPRASAFCEMLCSISEGAENALFAHRFLLDEDKHLPTKLRRSTSMSWSQMLAELQLYSTKASERQPTTQPSVLRLRKIDNADIHEPESPVMLTCYLRLISHLCRQSPDVRKWILEHPTINVSSMLLALCNAPIPNHLRAAIFVTLRCLMIDRTAAHGNEMWQLIDQWTSGSGLSSTTLPKSPAISTNVSLVWNERNAFQRIAEGFDQTRAFVELLNNLVCPASDAAVSQLCLTFPESLGSSYRMPGIEPYVDFVMGQAFATRSAALDDKESRGLRLSCLQFVATCLQSFNESLVSVAVQQPLAASSLLRSSSISTYIRLHPFYRVMEWLFNEEIIRVLFQAAHQDIEEVGKSRPGSILLDSLIRSIDVMNLIVDNQATYFELSRLGTKSQPQPGSSNIASSSLASFEDSVMDNLSLITDLCLYCGPGHPQLTLTSLALLEKLSGSRKLNKSSTMTTRWQPVSQIVELLNSSNGIEGVARSLTLQMSPDIREIEGGPGTAGHLIKGGLLNLLSRCLQMINDKPSMAHILLGFSCVGNALDIPTDGLFEHRASLFHAIVEFVQSYPEGNGQSIVWWMLHLRRLGLQVLQHLWSSPLSAGFVLRELRAAQLLRVLFIGHQTVTISTLWDGIPITAPQFWYENSAESLREFFAYRGLLFNYATTELRSAARESPPSLQRSVLGTLLGRSFDEQGTTIPHPSIFDLFDFVDLDIVEDVGIPALTFFRDFDPEIFAKQQEDAPVTLYDLDAVQEFLQLVGDDLLETGRISPQDNEQLLLEAENVIALLRARNCNRQVLYNRFIALKSWTELASTIVVTCDLEPSRMAMLILQVFQLILPKLEQSVERNNAEAVELARLAETLINKLDAVTSTTSEDVIEERMYSLFQACIHAIPLALELSDLRQIFYHICTTYLSRITRFGASHSRFGHRAQQTVKASGSGLFEILCDDAFSGTESCRISALLLLSLLAVLDHQQDSSLLVTVIVQSNYLGIFLDVVRGMATEFRNASAAETPHLLVFYEAQLALLEQLSQTRAGATHLLDAGLFEAVKESQLFAADPDIGLDIENPDALRRYYDLLLSVVRVIVSTVFSRGLHNQQIVEQTRIFLSENRSSVVGIFKRHAKIGRLSGDEPPNSLEDLIKSYTTLIAAVGYLEFEDEQLQTTQAAARRVFS